MASIAPSNAQPLSQLYSLQQSLATLTGQQSTGKRLTSPAVDPSGYAIATSLAVQASALNAATQNVQEAFNAGAVASGALQQLSGIATQLRDLAVTGVNDFLSPTDRAALQAQANQLVQQFNTVAQNVNFNGVTLLNGSFAGPQAGTPAAATVTNNDVLQNGGGIVSQVAAAGPNFQNATGPAQGFGGNGTLNSTVQIQIVNNNGTAAAQATVIDSATGQRVTSGLVASGGAISGFENVNIQLGAFTLGDVGKTATIQIAQNVPANTQNNALTVQSGASEGATSNLALPGVSSSQLAISNVNLSSSLTSTNAIGQLDGAIQTLAGAQANVGAQQLALQNQADYNNVNQLNLTSAQSNLTDLNYGQSTTESTLALLRSQLNTSLIAHNNVLAGLVLGLFTNG